MKVRHEANAPSRGSRERTWRDEEGGEARKGTRKGRSSSPARATKGREGSAAKGKPCTKRWRDVAWMTRALQQTKMEMDEDDEGIGGNGKKRGAEEGGRTDLEIATQPRKPVSDRNEGKTDDGSTKNEPQVIEKIHQAMEEDRKFFSFEFFPPKTEEVSQD